MRFDDATKRVKAYIDTGNTPALLECAEQAFLEKDTSEDTLAWITGVIYESKITEGYDYVPLFVERFPDSSHIIRVYLADLWAQRGQYDMATNHARVYLRQIKEYGVLDDLDGNPIVMDGVARGFLLLTAVYTEMGARSYSLRVLKYALNYPLNSYWMEKVSKEIEELALELETHYFKELDQMWEGFFENGSNAADLEKMILEKDFEYLAKRIDVLAGQIHSKGPSQVGEEEILKLIFTDGETYSLA